MSEEAEFWEQYRAHQREHHAKQESRRSKYDIELLERNGIKCDYYGYEKVIIFTTKFGQGKLFPRTGWWSCKGIGSDRGVHKLLKKLREKKWLV